MENISCLWSDILDCIGYGKEIISIRRKYWQQLCWPTFNEYVTRVVVGSKAEGIASLYESDVDLMYLCKDAICSDDKQDLTPVSGFTTLYLETRETPPGYTRLKMISCQGKMSSNYLKKCFFASESSDVYISSSSFASLMMRDMDILSDLEFLNALFETVELSGPAVPTTIFRFLKVEMVAAIPCNYQKILKTWKKRKHRYTWPPEDVIEAASAMQPQVVPVGSKISENQGLEWRFCFIKSELKLISSLNETQIKLYILLKMVAKDILKNVSKDISSYMMKNIIFWMSELLPEELFKKDKLISLLHLSMMYLKLFISESNWIPYYMIPGRNLLAERISPESRRHICDLIGTLIAEGPGYILIRCSKLKAAWEFIFTSTIPLDVTGTKRDFIEELIYLISSKVTPLLFENDFVLIVLTLTCIFLTIPELKTLIDNGISLTEITLLFQERFLLQMGKFISFLS